jgi:hypothetical protein
LSATRRPLETTLARRPREGLPAVGGPADRWRDAWQRHERLFTTIGVVVFCVLIWIWRRPGQLTHPYVWDEEVTILRHYLSGGFIGALRPVEGYLILPPAFLFAVAAKISIAQLPWLTYAFALLIFVATILMIIVPDSRWGDLKIRAGMAATATLVPTNPEVFGILLYSFWWATLWPLIVLGWRRSLWALRAPLLAIAALSSPAGGSIFFIYAISYWRSRRVQDAIGAAILFAGFVVQSVLTLTSSRANSISASATPWGVTEQIARTGGFFETRWLATAKPDLGFAAFAGVVFLGFLLGAGVYLLLQLGRDDVALMALGALTFTVITALPSPLVSDPVSTGPRYYFLPFVAFGWVLILILKDAPLRGLAVAAAVLLGLSFFNLATTFSRSKQTTVAHLSWRTELDKCGRSKAGIVPVPIYFDGSYNFWSIDFTPARCRQLLGESAG